MSKTLSAYVQAVEDDLARTVYSEDGARNLVESYVNDAIHFLIGLYPWKWAVVADGTASNTVAIVAGTFRYALPADTLHVRSAYLVTGDTSGRRLRRRTIEWMDKNYPDLANQSAARPAVYALPDNANFILAPPPDASYSVVFRRTQLPAPLSGATVSIIPAHLDWVVQTYALAFAWTRGLRNFRNGKEYFTLAQNGAAAAISIDKQEMDLNEVAEPFDGGIPITTSPWLDPFAGLN